MPREAPYLAVAGVLRARILAGEWEIGGRLPSRARLAEEYGVGRNVIQRAIDRMITDGLLKARAGSGTYVRTPRERLRLVRSRHRESRGGSFRCQQGNAHLPWHTGALPPGVPYEQPQFHALMSENGVLSTPSEETADMATRLRAAVAARGVNRLPEEPRTS